MSFLLLNTFVVQEAQWPTIIFTVAAAVMVVCCVYYYCCWTTTTKNGNSQGVCAIAPTGMIENIQQMGGTRAPFFLLETMEQCQSDIYKLRLPVRRGGFFVVGDPYAAREILLDPQTDKPKEIYSSFRHVSHTKSTTVFTSTTDARWQNVRKGIMPAFSSREVHRMTSICTQQLNHWIEHTLEQKIAKNETFDPSAEINRLVFHSIVETGFEYKSTDEEFRAYHDSLGLALKEFSFRQSLNPLREPLGLLFPDRREAHRAAGRMSQFIEKIMTAYRNKEDKSENNTIIKVIMNHPALETDEDRRAELNTLLIGGHDTTAYQLASTLVLLAKHERVAQKLRSELAKLDESLWKNCAYLHHVLKEAQRIMPVAATGSIRLTGREHRFEKKKGEVIIPSNAIVFFPFIIMMRNASIFPDPHVFQPERWEHATQEMKDAHMLFSLGKRNCAGQSLANAELMSCLPKLIANYHFEVVDEGRIEYFLTLKYVGTKLRATRIIQ